MHGGSALTFVESITYEHRSLQTMFNKVQRSATESPKSHERTCMGSRLRASARIPVSMRLSTISTKKKFRPTPPDHFHQ